MAENNSIRANSSSGYSEDFAQQLTSFAATSQELREVVKTLATAVNELNKNVSSNKGSTNKSKIDKAYEDSLKQLKNSKDFFVEANKLINKTSQNVYKGFGDIVSLQKEYEKEFHRLGNLRTNRDLSVLNKDNKKTFKYNNRIEASADRLEQLQGALTKQLEKKLKYERELDSIKERESSVIQKSMQSISNLSSSMDAFKPERVKNWETMRTNITSYLNPKSSQSFKDIQNIVNKRNTEIAGDLSSLNLEKLNVRKQRAMAESDLERDILDKQAESLELQIEKLEEERLLINKQMDNLEQETTVLNNIKNTAINFIKKTLTSAVDKEMDNLRSAASDVFNSFETTQKTIAKQLKLSSGEYDDLKQQLIDAANEAGKAIDVTQLNEAAVSISEMGISDTDLIREMAVGIAKLSEAGVSAKLDEETAKQMNATYAQLVRNGMDSTAAAETVGKRFDDMIAIQEQIRQQYGNTFALENGGWQEIMNWVNKVEGMGLIGSEEDRQALMASLANSQAALASAGITDPSAMLSTLEGMMQNPLGENNAFVYDWMNSYGKQLGVTDINTLYEQLGKGNGGDILMSLNKRAAELAQQGDYNATAYLKQAYGMDLTTEQLVGLSRLGEAESLYGEADYSSASLEKYGRAVAKGLEDGKYLTATEKLEKTNISLMQELASKYQDIPDGAFWMSEGFTEIKSIVDGAVEFLLTGLFSGNLFGGGGTGGTGAGGVGGSAGTPGAFGIGTASYGTMAVGGVLSSASAIKNFYNAESFEEGLIDTFRDPTFTAGLGTTIGGAVGGPIGGAIGGALGSFVPTVSKTLEDWLCSTVHDPSEQIEKTAQQLEDAAKELGQAASAHNNSANAIQTEINEQERIFASYDENQKKNFIEQMNINTEDKTINEAFDEAVKAWVDGQLKEKENQELLAEGSKGLVDNFGAAFGVDNATNWDKNTKLSVLQDVASKYGIDTAGKSNKTLREEINAYEENRANQQIIRSESGYTAVENAMKYAENLGMDISSEEGKQEALKTYFEAIGADYTPEQIASMAEAGVGMLSDKEAWDRANTKFQEALKPIIAEDPNMSYTTLFDKYLEKYPHGVSGKEDAEFSYSSIEGLDHDMAGFIQINGANTVSAGGIPELRHTARAANQYNYDPALYDGKYLTGLDYVPMDNFLALLHQGEMVLTKSEAEQYKTDNFDSSAITSSVDSQTDKLVDILNKILQILTYKTSSGTGLPKSLVQMNSDISLL